MENCQPGGPCAAVLRGMQIGKDLEKRLATGEIGDDRVMNYEKEQQKKLKCVDDAHTTLSNLTFKEASRYILEFEDYLDCSTPAACPDQQARVLECLQENWRDVMLCSREVGAFSNCVDEMMRSTSRHNGQDGDSGKKLSYTEKFEQISEH